MNYAIIVLSCLLIAPSCSLRKDKGQKVVHTKRRAAKKTPPIISSEEAKELLEK